MSQDRLYQPLAEANIALFRDDKNIGEVGKGRLVGDDAGKADLPPAAI
jgi:hypothetical protein